MVVGSVTALAVRKVVVIGSGNSIVLAQSPSTGATVHEGESVTIYVAR